MIALNPILNIGFHRTRKECKGKKFFADQAGQLFVFEVREKNKHQI
jgi:hypothetical protein